MRHLKSTRGRRRIHKTTQGDTHMKRIQLSNTFRMASPLLGLALLTFNVHCRTSGGCYRTGDRVHL